MPPPFSPPPRPQPSHSYPTSRSTPSTPRGEGETLFYSLGKYDPFTGKTASPFHTQNGRTHHRPLLLLQNDRPLASFLFSLPPSSAQADQPPMSAAYAPAAGNPLRDNDGVNLVLGLLEGGDHALLLPSLSTPGELLQPPSAPESGGGRPSSASASSSPPAPARAPGTGSSRGTGTVAGTLPPFRPRLRRAGEFLSLSPIAFPCREALLRGMKGSKQRRSGHKGGSDSPGSGAGTRVGMRAGGGWRGAEFEWARMFYRLYLSPTPSPSKSFQQLSHLCPRPPPARERQAVNVVLLQFNLWNVSTPEPNHADVVLDAAWARVGLPTQQPHTGFRAGLDDGEGAELGQVAYVCCHGGLRNRGREWAAYAHGSPERLTEPALALHLRQFLTSLPPGPVVMVVHDTSLFSRALVHLGLGDLFPQAAQWLEEERRERYAVPSPLSDRASEEGGRRWETVGELVGFPPQLWEAEAGRGQPHGTQQSDVSRSTSGPGPVRKKGWKGKCGSGGRGAPTTSSRARQGQHAQPDRFAHQHPPRHEGGSQPSSSNWTPGSSVPPGCWGEPDGRYPSAPPASEAHRSYQPNQEGRYPSAPPAAGYAPYRREYASGWGGWQGCARYDSSPGRLTSGGWGCVEMGDYRSTPSGLRGGVIDLPLRDHQGRQSHERPHSPYRTEQEEGELVDTSAEGEARSPSEGGGSLAGVPVGTQQTVRGSSITSEEETELIITEMESCTSGAQEDEMRIKQDPEVDSTMRTDRAEGTPWSECKVYLIDTHRLLQAVGRTYTTEFALWQLAVQVGLASGDEGMCAGNEIHTLWEAAKILMSGPSVLDASAALAELRTKRTMAAKHAPVVEAPDQAPTHHGIFGRPGPANEPSHASVGVKRPYADLEVGDYD